MRKAMVLNPMLALATPYIGTLRTKRHSGLRLPERNVTRTFEIFAGSAS
jgi:hypothetical protein